MLVLIIYPSGCSPLGFERKGWADLSKLYNNFPWLAAYAMLTLIICIQSCTSIILRGSNSFDIFLLPPTCAYHVTSLVYFFEVVILVLHGSNFFLCFYPELLYTMWQLVYLWGKSLLNPPPFIHGLFHAPNYETVCFTPWTFQNRLFYPPRRFFTTVLLQ